MMIKVKTVAACFSALLVCAGITNVHASTIYTDRTAWSNSTSGTTTLDFESYGGAGNHLGDFTDSGVSFDAQATYGPDAYIFTWGPSSGYNIGSGNWILGGFSVPGSYRRYVDATVPTVFNAFGLDVSTYGNTGYVSVTATTNLGIFEQIVATPYGGSSFVGFTLDAGEMLSYLRIENVASATGGVGNDNFLFDNFSFGTKANANVPEPSSIIILGLGLLGIVSLRKKNQSSSQ